MVGKIVRVKRMIHPVAEFYGRKKRHVVKTQDPGSQVR